MGTTGFLETSLTNMLKFQANERTHLKLMWKDPEDRLSPDRHPHCRLKEIKPKPENCQRTEWSGWGVWEKLVNLWSHERLVPC